jgi:hypothetical protein
MPPLLDDPSGPPESVPATSIISSHATSQGLLIYYRREDDSIGVVLEPRPVMPKQVVLDRTA